MLSKYLWIFFIILPLSAFQPEVYEEVKPYLLPDDHPLQPKLKKLFSKDRPTANLLTLTLNGFTYTPREKKDQIIVAKHKALKGYLLKLYVDSQIGIPDYPMWIKRIHGAQVAQQAIDKLGANHAFKVPKKWIYPLPNSQADQKNFILIVEDMHIKDPLINEQLWQNAWVMIPERMTLLFQIIQLAGLKDSVYIDNVPFCRDGRQAFIDTEHFNRWPIDFGKLIGSIPQEYRDHWRSLISE